MRARGHELLLSLRRPDDPGADNGQSGTPRTAIARCGMRYAAAPWSIRCTSSLSGRFARSATVGGVVTDHTCVTCHNPVNAAAKAAEVPAGQLDLTDSASSIDATLFTSYEELLFAHDEQVLLNGVLEDLLVPAPGPPGPGGTPTTIMVPVSLAPPMTAGSASGSVVKFLRMFDGTYQDPVLDHTGFLTTGGVAFDRRMAGHWRAVLQRSLRRAGCELRYD